MLDLLATEYRTDLLREAEQERCARKALNKRAESYFSRLKTWADEWSGAILGRRKRCPAAFAPERNKSGLVI